jgi:hypothetical protein
MNIFAQAKYGSPSQFKCDDNVLIFRAIGHELCEVCEFHNMLPGNGNFQLVPSVLCPIGNWVKYRNGSKTNSSTMTALFLKQSSMSGSYHSI